MNYLLIRNDPPYGTERSYNGLRLANSLAKDDKNTVAVFLMGDAASCGVAGQNDPKRVLQHRALAEDPGLEAENSASAERAWTPAA